MSATPSAPISGRMPTRIVVIDDEQDMRASISQWLSLSGFQPEAYGSAEEALPVLSAEFPGIVISDIRMPGMDGMALLKKLAAMDSALPVILITGHGDVPMAVEAMRSGAVDFLLKPFQDTDLLDRVSQALAMDAANQAERSELAAIRERIACLTPRELEVMHLVVQGRANKVIATDLNLSQRTVEIHRARVMDKMGATSLAHLVRMVLDVEAG